MRLRGWIAAFLIGLGGCLCLTPRGQDEVLSPLVSCDSEIGECRKSSQQSQSALESAEAEYQASLQSQSQLAAVVLAVPRQMWPVVKSHMKEWPKCSTSRHAVDLVLMLDRSRDAQLEAEVAQSIKETGLTTCFSNVRFTTSERTEDGGSSVSQANSMWYDSLLSAHLKGYSVISYLPVGCSPVQHHWLEKMQALASKQSTRFWMKGNIFADSNPALQVPKLGLCALYATAETQFIEMLQAIWQQQNSNLASQEMGTMLASWLLSNGNYKFLQQHAHRFVFTEAVQRECCCHKHAARVPLCCVSHLLTAS